MKRNITILLLGLAMISCSRQEPPPAAPAANTQDSASLHDAHAEHASTPAPALPAGHKWPTDEPLRQAMSRIGAALEPVQAAYDHKQLSASDAQAFATLVDENVAYMVANCKLEPQADAALHAIIAHMLTATAAMKKDPAAESGVPQVTSALHHYETTFDHAG